MLLGKDLTNFGSCIQHKDADFAKPGTEDSSTYMFDVPRYEKMAFAAALSGNSVDPSDLSSLRTTLADNQSVQSSIKSSINDEQEVRVIVDILVRHIFKFMVSLFN